MPVNPRAANATLFPKNHRTMNPRPILITAAALALSAWPLRAQDNAPERPPGPPPREDGPRRPDADRPDAPQQSRDERPRDGQFHRENQGPQRERAQEPRGDGPPPPQGKRDGDFRREGPAEPPQQAERRERADGPQQDRRGGEQGPRFEQQDRGPGMPMPPPRMEQRVGANDGDPRMGGRRDGMRRHQRRMMDDYRFAPRREVQDFRRGENEMRPPMPPPPQGPRFDRSGPDRGSAPAWDRMNNQGRLQNGPRPEFGPRGREDQGFGPGPRPQFDGPRPQDFRGAPPPRPHREGAPRPGWEEGRGRDF